VKSTVGSQLLQRSELFHPPGQTQLGPELLRSRFRDESFGNGAVGCGKFGAFGPWPLLVCFVLAAFSLKIIDFENVDFACRPRWFPLSGPNGLVEKIRHQGLLATANNH